jgi:hypothetical protein
MATLALAQGPTTITVAFNAMSTTGPVYTNFDLFKNSDLTFCTVNTRAQADTTTKDLIVQRTVRNQSELCSYMAGVPIMIPTEPTQTAFFPWYPTHLAQGLSLGISYVGLYYIFRYLDRSRMLPSRRRLPWYFWPILLLDLARQVAFAYNTIQGFVSPDQFGWTNKLLWLVPLNYVFLAKQLHEARKDKSYEEPYAGSNMQFAQLRSNGRIDFTNSPFPAVLTGPQSPIHSIKEQDPVNVRSSFPTATRSSGGFSSIVPELPTRESKGLTTWLAIISTAGLWFLSFVYMILHWKWSYGTADGSWARTYPPIAAALTDPQTIGNMPLTCLAYLQSNNLSTKTSFFKQTSDQMTFAIIGTLQFLLSMMVLVYAYWRRRDEPFDRSYRVLYASASVSLILLLVPAFATGVAVGTQILREGEDVSLRFTNDLDVTGGCTFAFVTMSKRFGYWDVDLNRASRIVYSFLGAV